MGLFQQPATEQKMAKKDAQMDRLGEVLSHSLKRLELTPRLDEYGVWPIWNEVVGKTIAANAQPEKIRNGTLFVKVTSPVWMQQLQFMKDMIAEKLNQRLKSEVVQTIFFMVGRIDAPANEPQAEEPKSEAGVAPRQVSEEFLQSIEDPEIREAFRKLLKSFKQRKAKG
jgi:predicted nucleic acid-binding Zn ribbon protein